jgi:hypothetical protein
MSIRWLINSWRGIGSEGVLKGEIEGSANSKGRELGVEEEKRI